MQSNLTNPKCEMCLMINIHMHAYNVLVMKLIYPCNFLINYSNRRRIKYIFKGG